MQLVVARVGRAHGIKGEVTVEVRTDEPELRLGPGAVLLTDPASAGPLTIETGRVHSGRLLLRFAGVRDRNAAEALRNTLLIAEVDRCSSRSISVTISSTKGIKTSVPSGRSTTN
ncbi:hypothetical protein ACFVRU_16330, partial [Streptomyces sp. NPDC057927]